MYGQYELLFMDITNYFISLFKTLLCFSTDTLDDTTDFITGYSFFSFFQREHFSKISSSELNIQIT